MPEPNEYGVFLDTWKPSELLRYATIDSNLFDPVSHERLFNEMSDDAPVERKTYVQGAKIMDIEEKRLRGYDFFEMHSAEWSAEFRNRLLSADLDKEKLDNFVRCFAELWVDGKNRRQNSSEMLAIKASIRNLDRLRDPFHAGRFVLNAPDDSVNALFTPDEMSMIFDVNERLLEIFMADYMDHLKGNGPGSINNIYVRRGVLMPQIESIRKELHYLSSYSLAIGPVEQFAQTWTSATRRSGVPSIFAAPLPALQNRVVAFAPFIEGMDLSQLEFVVAPPTLPTPLKLQGNYGGILEYTFE